jgi:hypothetical protein
LRGSDLAQGRLHANGQAAQHRGVD